MGIELALEGRLCCLQAVVGLDAAGTCRKAIELLLYNVQDRFPGLLRRLLWEVSDGIQSGCGKGWLGGRGLHGCYIRGG